MRNILPGEFYRHFKNKLYQVKGIAYHSETHEKMVVYQAMYGDFKWYVRPYEMFVSEVDRSRYPDAAQKYRFEKVEAADIENAQIDRSSNDINAVNSGLGSNIGSRAAFNTESKSTASSSLGSNTDRNIDSGGESTADIGNTIEIIETDRPDEAADILPSPINPALEAFLDAKSYRDKINVLVSIRNKMDDRLINDIATSMDVTVPDGPIEERFMSLKRCVMTHAKYEESNRLR